MDPPQPTYADLVATVAMLVQRVAALERAAGAAVRAEPADGRRRRTRRTADQLDRLAADLAIFVRQRGNVPDDATLAVAIGVPVATLRKWKQQGQAHPVGRKYWALVQTLARRPQG